MSAANQKSLTAYLIGFSLCVLLTVSAFAMLKWHLLVNPALSICLAIFAIAQLFVQCICFLGLKTDQASQWRLLPFLFTILIIMILASGSLWIMYNLNYFMQH